MSAGLFNMLYSGANHVLAQGRVDINRITQASKNRLQASNASLAQWEQSFQNRRAVNAAGDQINSINENLSRSLDAATYGTTMSRLRAAEEVGANIADAAYAGVGGSTVDQAISTMGLTQAMQEEQVQRQVDTQQYAMGVAKGDILSAAVQGQGNQIFQANLDYTTFQDHKKMSSSRMLFTTLAAGVATYYGGPQAGAAVFDFSDSQYRAKNGDMQGSAQMLERSITQGLTAASGFTTRGNVAWGSDFMSGFRGQAASGANLQIGGPDTSTLSRNLNSSLRSRRGY